jgi:UDP-glucose 4-epimerase
MFGDGRQTRDFTFVNDAVSATIAAAERGQPGSVYNIGGGSRVSMLDVIETIQTITGKTLRIDFLEKQKGDMRDTYADTSAARRDLDYAPRTSLQEGLEREWEWVQTL